MSKKNITIFAIAINLFFGFVPLSVGAVESGGAICSPTAAVIAESGTTDVYVCVNRIYRYAIVVGSITAVLFIVIAGYLYMFSGGSDANVSTAKSLIQTSLLGVGILLAGLLILKQINPEILKLKTISPTRIPGEAWVLPVVKVPGGTTGGGGGGGTTYSGGPGIPGNNSGPAGHSASELSCSFQGSKANYVKYMTETLFQAIKKICAEVKSKGMTAAISSISTGHIQSPGSLHNRGCATDFAGGDKQYTLTPVGKAVIEAAKKTGARINPGTDANQTYHVHVDVGPGNCTAPVLPLSART